MLNNNRRIYYFFLFSILLFIIGISFIINSNKNILLFKDNFSNQKTTKLTLRFNAQEDFLIFDNDFSNQKIKKLAPRFIFREDLSIKNLSINNNLDKDIIKDNQSADQSINLNNFALKTVIVNNGTSLPYLQKLPNELDTIKDIKTKKEKFILSILPVILQENENIRSNRNKLLKIKGFLVVHKTLNRYDQQFLEHLASQYNINTLNKHKIDTIETLLKLVDVIPNSIVIAQAANESGWGTSRFAKEFNALFGEYTFDTNNGVAPALRDDGEKHLIKLFPTINESIRSYFINLNTHSAYKEFRTTRKQLRKFNLKLDPMILVKHLKPYAEDKNYVKTLVSIIKTNKLIQFDSLKIITTKS